MSKEKIPLAIDMTYKVGPFFTTCLSIPHPVFVHKNDDLKHPSVFLGMLTSTGRQVADYHYLASQLKNNNIHTLIYGTDGELALKKAFETVYPIEGSNKKTKNIHLRCFNHVKEDLEAELKNHHVTNPVRYIQEILGSEYRNVRINGLVDTDKSEYEETYKDLSKSWPSEFKSYIESTSFRVRSLKGIFIKCMRREVRTNAGLGSPPNKYENQRAEMFLKNL